MTASKFYLKLCWAEKCQEYDLNLVAPGTCDVISRRDEVRAVCGSEGSVQWLARARYIARDLVRDADRLALCHKWSNELCLHF